MNSERGMATRVTRPYEPERPLALPLDLRSWLPTDHTVYLLSDIVDQLDVSPITAFYDRGMAVGTSTTTPCC